MHDGRGRRGRRFVTLPAHGGGISGKAVGGDFSDEAHIVNRREEVEIFRPADLCIGEHAIAEEKPAGSPSLAVIGPLVENSGHRGLGSPPRNAVRSTSRETPRPGQRSSLGLRRVAPDPRTFQRDAAQGVHFLHTHFQTFFLVFSFTCSLEQKVHLKSS